MRRERMAAEEVMRGNGSASDARERRRGNIAGLGRSDSFPSKNRMGRGGEPRTTGRGGVKDKLDIDFGNAGIPVGMRCQTSPKCGMGRKHKAGHGNHFP